MTSIKKNTILNAIRMTLTVLMPLITFPYTSRVFSTDGIGRLDFVNSNVQVFSLIASLGIYTYGIREGAKVRNDKEKFSNLVYQLLLINLVSTIIVYAVFTIAVLFFPKYQDYRELFLIYSITIGLNALGLDWVFGAYEDYRYITIRQIVMQVFTIASLFIFVHTKDDLNIWACMLAISVSGANLFNLVYSRKYVKWKGINHTYLSEVQNHIKPILIIFATQISAKIYTNVDTVLIGIMAQDTNVGLYSAAIKVNTLLITFFTAMTPVFMPRIVEYINSNDDIGFHTMIRKIVSIILCLGIPLSMGIMLMSDEIITIISGDDFKQAAVTMKILAPIVLFSSLANVLSYNILIPRGKEATLLKTTLFTTVVNILVSILLIPNLKENGAAIGSVVAELTGVIVLLVCCEKGNDKIRDWMPGCFNYVMGGMIVFLTCVTVKQLINGMVFRLILAVGLSAVLYAVYLFARKDPMGMEFISLAERKIIKKSES